ncbi:glutathione S-transferase family protein [Notoacmeibacter sp. MSK16QG-6]|uniref:glutathione S-transferase family protein n=1 Tax=Notoacmeibacter sp. MSK16QG-6 TaxID=2957982 RepID=UPI00209C7A39|nr:glutathione S-transferase family protein [Notoacmeibacter sp. MSK16QG-6]MCP1197958.1 glutathione S-transferase family protein [Notoacmeibacter sp. MSK16QG-6]
MPRLLYSDPSPYSAKARMGLTLANIVFESVPTDTNAEPTELMEANPLGKIPVLILDDNRKIFDSGAILRYADRMSGNGVYPLQPDARLDAEVMESLSTGLCDAMVAMIYERRFRPEEMVYQGWIDKQLGKAKRGFAFFEGDVPSLDDGLHGGHITLRAAIGYAKLRMPNVLNDYPDLCEWASRFDRTRPDLATLLPK